jgi:hypothetical protein
VLAIAFAALIGVGAVAAAGSAAPGSFTLVHRVTASDNVEGVVPVSCQPRSGSRFTIGRTLVTCSAPDKSGNTRAAKFRITVRASQ